MRLLTCVALGLALALGCGDDANTAPGGASGGGTGGSGGNGGGGAGGDVITTRAAIVYSPTAPCAEGEPSDYVISIQGDRNLIRELRADSTQCTSFAGTERSTITCDNDPVAIDYRWMLADAGGAFEFEVSGTFAACEGFYSFLGASQAPADRPPFLDLFVQPESACAADEPSDYSVSVLVDGVRAFADNVELELANCVGTIDSSVSTYSCTNEDGVLPYTIRAGEGVQRIEISGVVEACTANLFMDLQ